MANYDDTVSDDALTGADAPGDYLGVYHVPAPTGTR